MPLTPPPRLQQSPSPDMGVMPLAGDPDDVPAPDQSQPTPSGDPGALEDAQNILLITAAARRLANKYPSAVPDVQTINDAVQKLQMKIMMVQPPAETALPPQ